jgi:hypothetical protein
MDDEWMTGRQTDRSALNTCPRSNNLDCLEFIQNGIGAITEVASLSLDDSSKMRLVRNHGGCVAQLDSSSKMELVQW